jgi:hypothetical protein
MNVIKIFSIVFASIGTIVSGVAIYLYSDTQSFLRDAAETEGTVIGFYETRSEGNPTYAAIVSYDNEVTRQKRQFTNNVSSYPAGYYEGEKVRVLYDKNNPNKEIIRDFTTLYLGSTITGILGIVFAAVGFGIMLYGIKQGKKRDYLQTSGLKIEADFQEIIYDTSIRVNGRSPYRILAQKEHGGLMYVFKSEGIWYDPSSLLENKKTIDVLVDSRNWKTYWVDIRFLPTKA